MYRISGRAEQDKRRLEEKYNKLLSEGLTDLLSRSVLEGSHGNKRFKITTKRIAIPKFKFGANSSGVGMGPGEAGDPISQDASDKRMQKGNLGKGENSDFVEVEVDLGEVVEVLWNDLKLPKLRPSPKTDISLEGIKYRSRSVVGPDSLRDSKRTYLRALRREIAQGNFVSGKMVVPTRHDFVYRAPKNIEKPAYAAAVIYVMDVSPSMGDVERNIAKKEASLTSALLDRMWRESTGRGISQFFVIHGATAYEVQEKQFYTTALEDGTRVFVGLQEAIKIACREMDKGVNNVYIFHYTDGDIFDSYDERFLDGTIREALGVCNMYAVTQIRNQEHSNGWVALGPHGENSGYLRRLKDHFPKEINNSDIITSYIPDEGGEHILRSIRDKLATGR